MDFKVLHKVGSIRGCPLGLSDVRKPAERVRFVRAAILEVKSKDRYSSWHERRGEERVRNRDESFTEKFRDTELRVGRNTALMRSKKVR